MARLFPLRSDAQSAGDEPRVVDLEDEDADAVFGALSSSTAREIYSRLAEEPGTPSDVAEAVDSSIQNVRYHLEKLEDAGLVEVVDTWYSSRGNEMSVYATADGPLIVTSDESTASKVRTALSRFLGGVGALAAGSLLVQYGLQQYATSGIGADAGTAGGSDDSSGGDAGGSSGDAGGDAETMDEHSGDDGSSSDGGTTNDGSTADDGGTGGDIGTTQHDGSNGNDDVRGDGTDNSRADSAPSEGNDAAGTADNMDGGAGTGEHEVADDGGILGDVFGDNVAETADVVFSSVPPGLLFFLGGLSVLVCVTIYWYWRSY
ncbi:ArsR family transcriptional regulator [Halostagnicola sp. A56]|uniref:ArsR/SmtB family transcription factor n=1 Tax=Halostagnicola sp. A56 TaxID=1495067 RepID=UPI0004A17303|nr:helix-turn-helix domain-containing protein [Halostagnicola sp. A56]KDE60519.1 ArsR family transcriptional regulator [Halostagnicola sp. A56]